MYNVTMGRVPATTVAVEKLSITYAGFMSVAFVIQHTVRMCHCHPGLSGSTIFFSHLKKGKI
jgi:hypothetical protein